MKCHYTCRHCGTEIECFVTLGEECDLGSECPDCNAPIPESAHEEMHTQACEKVNETPEYD
jgi:transcription initiation factor IIE alpha subunit